MKELEIYKKLGQILYATAPYEKGVINLAMCLKGKSQHSTFWQGEHFSAETGYHMASDSLIEICDLVGELNKVFTENEKGDWNVIHFRVYLEEGRFETDFEKSGELQKGNIPWWEYCEKYKKPKDG